MNAKKAKALRKNTPNWNQAIYIAGHEPRYEYLMGRTIKVQKGVPTKLDACGRKFYKLAKKVSKG